MVRRENNKIGYLDDKTIKQFRIARDYMGMKNDEFLVYLLVGMKLLDPPRNG